MGLSLGIGVALSAKRKSKNYKTYVIIGDGKCNEGSVWEAALSAVELALNNLVVIVDCNGHQNDGPVPSQMSAGAMAKKWSGFGWSTVPCDGQNFKELMSELSKVETDKPKALIAKTIKGRGVSFMENNNDWHHNRLSQKIYNEALKDLLN